MQKDQNKLVENLGKRFTQLRKEAGYSNQESFAHDAGIARGQYARYEKGANINLLTLQKILKFHKITFSEFFLKGF